MAVHGPEEFVVGGRKGAGPWVFPGGGGGGGGPVGLSEGDGENAELSELVCSQAATLPLGFQAAPQSLHAAAHSWTKSRLQEDLIGGGNGPLFVGAEGGGGCFLVVGLKTDAPTQRHGEGFTMETHKMSLSCS